MALPKNMRRKVKFLTVVWGEAYIARFAGLALPSFIAPGNLPALAEATNLEFVIMTRSSDIDFFDHHPTFRMLRAICPVRFVEIDDLITTGVYGVTLTLAYARPIIASGREMLDIHFVFMNADFVLADGSLRSLCRHIQSGRSIVLGPSFRATAEAVEPLLKAAVDKATGTLSITPREMAGLSLPHPHPTTIAKIVNQDLCHSTHPNQFFWRIDEQTLLGRYYLIFMLCLKPERIIKTINSFCDYALIPEMCPSGDEVVMGDSDDFFMLELQQRMQETEMLCLGRQPVHEIAKSLQTWTTAEHRRAVHHDIVFHAGDIPPGLDAAKAEAQNFIDNIQQRLGTPIPHAEHRYWIRGVEAWKSLRKSRNLSVTPPELGSSPDQLRNQITWTSIRRRIQKLSWFIAYKGQQLILGQSERSTLLNPYWADHLHLRDTLGPILSAPGGRVLIVRNNPEQIDLLVGANPDVTIIDMREALDEGNLALRVCHGHTHIFIDLQLKDCGHLQDIITRCWPALNKDGQCCIFIHNRNGETNEGLSPELLSLVEGAGTAPFQINHCTFVGGALKQFNRDLFSRMGRSYVRRGTLAMIWIFPLLVISIPLMLASNFFLYRHPTSSRTVSCCSSIAIHLCSS